MKGVRRAARNSVALVAAAAVAGTLTAAAEPKTGPGGAVGPGNVRTFAAEFSRTFGAAIPPLIGQLNRAAVRGGRQTNVATTVKGATGSIRVRGTGVTQPSPAHWDLTLTFGTFAAPAKKGRTPLAVSGALQFNVVTPGRAALGLFRGFLTLGGAFGGKAEVVGEVQAGKVVALVVTSGGKRLVVGRAPRTLLSYVSTIAGGPGVFAGPTGIAVANDGRMFVADRNHDAIRAITPAGAVTTLAALTRPMDVGLSGTTLYAVADNKNAPLARIDTATGAVEAIVGPVGKTLDGFLPLCQSSCDGITPVSALPSAEGMDVHGGVIFIAQGYPDALRLATGSGSLHTLSNMQGSCAGIAGPRDVAKGLNGDLYWVAPELACYGVMVMHPDGSFGVVAGKPSEYGKADGSAANARFFEPKGLVFDGVRYLYVADTGNGFVRRVDVLTGDVITIGGCHCINADAHADGPGEASKFRGPRGLALDTWGDLYVADERDDAIRLIRIITDPARDPRITRFEPYALLRGSSAHITVTGENLGLTQSASLGAGVDVKVAAQSSKKLELDVSIAATAPVGTHTLTVSTFYGKVDTPPGLSLQVLDQNEPQVTVATIAGTGAWSPGVHDGPAAKQPFGFPAGMAALDSGRWLIADPLEQRIRFVGSKDGTERELVQLLLDNSGSASLLGAALAPLGPLGTLLNGPASALIGRATSALLLPIVKAAVDQYCSSLGDPCTWIELPWAGTVTPGDSNGFRMASLMFVPVDVGATTDASIVYAADAGNSRPRSIGLDPRPNPATKSATNMFDVTSTGDRPFSVADAGGNALYASVPQRHTIVRVDLKSGGIRAAFAGNDGNPGCEQKSGDAKHPLGIPLGLDGNKEDLFVADPFCGTVWRISKKDGSVKDMRGPFAGLGAGGGSCSDGPVAFATFGAPTDVAVDGNGNIWVADAGCNSIRELKDVWATKETSAITGALKGLLGGLAGRLPSSTVGKIQSAIDSAQPDFVEANRWWVITVAGSREGAAGFRDGLAGQSLFSGPLGLAAAPGTGGVTYVAVSDTGNKRIRLISVPG